MEKKFELRYDMNVHIVKSGIMIVAEKFLKNISQMKL